jgi:hypothetical protein
VRAAPFVIEQLTRNEQVSGSSPLVGSLFFLHFCRIKSEAKKRVGEILTLLTPVTTLTRRFLANQIPALRFHALLNEEAPEVELALIR